jgi:hypothetical protein
VFGEMADRDHQMKRIVLPSGKTIEVVFFDHPSAAPPAAREPAPASLVGPIERPPAERELQVCVNCGSDLVYPVHWEEADERSWHVTLRCPNCEWTEAGAFSQAQCDRFDDHLETGTEALTRDYRQLVTANMVDEIERFATALEADAILPVDF